MTTRTVPLTLVVAAVAGMSFSPAGAQSTDLSTYGLLAVDAFRSRGVTAQGVRHFGTTAADGLTRITGRIDAAASDVVGSHVTVANRASAACAVLFADVAERPVCAAQQPFTPPFATPAALADACGFPAAFPACGGESITVERGRTRVITPGSYGTIVVKGAPNPGTLVFDGAGAYALCGLTVGRRAAVHFQSAAAGRVDVFVAGVPSDDAANPQVGNGAFVGPAPAAVLGPADLHLYAAGGRARLARKADVRANVCAPDATLILGEGVRLEGTAVARTIRTGRVTLLAGQPPASTSTTTTTTTSTTAPSTTSTASPTTTTTAPPAACGNGVVEPGEACDPVGSLTCPEGSPGGAMLECLAGCLCPSDTTTTTTTVPTTSTTTSTTTTTTPTTLAPVCGNGLVEAGEACDPVGSLTCPSGSPGGAMLECLAGCLCPSDTTTTTTTVPPSTTTTAPPVTTTTTTAAPSSTTTTTLTTGPVCGNGIREDGEACDGQDFGGTSTACPSGSPLGALLCTPGCTLSTQNCRPIATAPEICGNCIDDNGNGLTDFEDPACCANQQLFAMSRVRGKVHPRPRNKSFFLVHSTLATSVLGTMVNPRANGQDVFVQVRPVGGTDVLCAMIPAKKFMTMGKKSMFWDRKRKLASAKGIGDMTLIRGRRGRLRLRTWGRNVAFPFPGTTGSLQITLGFRNALAGDAANLCSSAVAPLTARGKGARLTTP